MNDLKEAKRIDPRNFARFKKNLELILSCPLVAEPTKKEAEKRAQNFATEMGFDYYWIIWGEISGVITDISVQKTTLRGDGDAGTLYFDNDAWNNRGELVKNIYPIEGKILFGIINYYVIKEGEE